MSSEKLNQLRAGVLGANDGIVSVTGVVVGFLGATHDTSIVTTAGFLTLAAGAISMGAGEYASVAAQNDSVYANEHNVGSPWAAVTSSMIAFSLGGLLPLLGLLVSTSVVSVVIGSLAALTVTGVVSAKLSGGSSRRAVTRNLLCGLLAFAVTYLMGMFIG